MINNIREKIKQFNELIVNKFNKSKLSKNTRLKIVSLMFAIIFWMFVMDQVNPEMTKLITDVPVELLNESYLTDNNLMIMGQDEFAVNVVVSGRRNDILDVQASDIKITADLTGYGSGINSIPLQKKSLKDNIVISDISSGDIKVKLERVIEVPKSVHVELIGRVEAGYVVADGDRIQVSPEEVLVKGPESLVNSTDVLYGEISIEGATNGIVKDIPIVPVDNDGTVVQGVTLGREYVNVNIGVEKLKTLAIEPVIKGELPEGYELVDITVNPPAVTLKGVTSSIDEVKHLKTLPIDISGMTESYLTEVQLDIPEDVKSLYDTAPLMANVIIEEVQTKEFIYSIDEISSINLDESNTISIDDGGFDGIILNVTAISSLLEPITKSDFEVYFDAEGLEPGINEVELLVRTTPEIELLANQIEYEILPAKINVIIAEE